MKYRTEITWNRRKYSFKTRSLKYACILLASELGYRKEWAFGTEIYKELMKPMVKHYTVWGK